VPGVVRVREGQAWLADWRGTRGVLRCSPVPEPDMAGLAEDVEWLHNFLDRLAGTGFPAPRPLLAFGGKSWTIVGGHLWEIVSFISGSVVGWDPAPPLEEIGALLARYHAAARQIRVSGQRPGVIPLCGVPDILLSAGQPRRAANLDVIAAVRPLAARLARDLADGARPAIPGLVIHGDFTSHNVIAAGNPPRAVGVIDFARAHLDAPVADIAYGLWRSGRPRQDASVLDLARVQRLVHGYARTAALPAAEARVLPLYLYGRGLQMIAKRVQAGRDCAQILPQVCWIAANATAIADVAVAAL